MKEPKVKFNEGMAFASIVFGIIGIASALFLASRHASIGITSAAMGFAYGVVGLKTTQKRMALAGILIGSIGLAANVINMIASLPK